MRQAVPRLMRESLGGQEMSKSCLIGIFVGFLPLLFPADSNGFREYRSIKERIEAADYVVVGELANVREGFNISYGEDWGGRWDGLRMTYFTGELAVTEVLQGDRFLKSMPVFFFGHAESSDGARVSISIYAQIGFPIGQPGVWILSHSDLVGAYKLRYEEYYLPMDSLAIAREHAMLKKGRR